MMIEQYLYSANYPYRIIFKLNHQ